MSSGTSLVNIKLPSLCEMRSNNKLKETNLIMEECVKLNGNIIVCMNWSPLALQLNVINVTVPKQQNTDKNLSDLVAGVASFNLVSQANQSSNCDVINNVQSSTRLTNFMVMNCLVSVSSNCSKVSRSWICGKFTMAAR